MKKAEGLLKDSDVYILKVRLENDRLYSDLYSSREMTQNRRRSESRNLERIKQIDEDLSADGDGSIYLLQVLILSDLKFILPDEQLGIELRECILNNAVYNKGEYVVKSSIEKIYKKIKRRIVKKRKKEIKKHEKSKPSESRKNTKRKCNWK